eukprot:1582098-Amphidinium_carterae.1
MPATSLTTPTSSMSYPTDSALRAKQRQQQHRALTGQKPTVRHQHKPQETHHDDCGDDFSSIQDKHSLLLTTKEADPQALLAPFSFSVFRRNQSRFVLHFTEHSPMTEE